MNSGQDPRIRSKVCFEGREMRFAVFRTNMYSLEYIRVHMCAGCRCDVCGCVITFYPSLVLSWMILLLLVILGCVDGDRAA